MSAFKLQTHHFNPGRGLILILFLGLLAFGVHANINSNYSFLDEAHESQFLSQNYSPNSSGISFHTSTPQHGQNNSFLGLIASFEYDTEDERRYPQTLPLKFSFEQNGNWGHQPLALLLHLNFDDLALTILSTVVFLH